MITCNIAIDLHAASSKAVLARHSYIASSWHFAKKITPFILLLLAVFLCIRIWRSSLSSHAWLASNFYNSDEGDATILVITPTHKRPERLADMTRFSQTLSHVKNLHWIVVEDSNATAPAVERILQRSGLPYIYFHATTEPGMPKRGWTHRNRALQFIRENYAKFPREAVVYFADDDNAYDIRLFDRYIRKVKRIGFWAVGLSGAALVEAPRVENKKIVGWNVIFAPSRTFATDMAGFAINLKEILRAKNASFSLECAKKTPEPCFLNQFGIKKEECEPFGYDDEPKEILVWHVKTRNIGTRGERHGYVIE